MPTLPLRIAELLRHDADMSYSFDQLKSLWIQAGGSAQTAAMAAVVALAESGGNPNATNSNGDGSMDRGLWQINSVHGPLSTTDPMANARAAISISAGGSNWRPWCVAWSDGRCGGTYLGDGAPALNRAQGMGLTPQQLAVTIPGTGITIPSVDDIGSSASSALQIITSTFMRFVYYVLMGMAGALIIALGIAVLIASNTNADFKSIATLGIKPGSKEPKESEPPDNSDD